jgi:hypothetical protein
VLVSSRPRTEVKESDWRALRHASHSAATGSGDEDMLAVSKKGSDDGGARLGWLMMDPR